MEIFKVRLPYDSEYYTASPLQDIVIETMLGGENSVQGPLLLKLLFVGFKTMSPSVTLHIVQDIVIETMLGGENSVQGPLLLKLLFVGLKTMSPSVTLHIVIFFMSPS